MTETLTPYLPRNTSPERPWSCQEGPWFVPGPIAPTQGPGAPEAASGGPTRTRHFVRDREQLLHWIGAPPEDPPARSLLKLFEGLGFSVGSRPQEESSVLDLARCRVWLAVETPDDPRAQTTALAKALGHLRLHSHQPPENYRPWWEWEAEVYAAVFLCKSRWAARAATVLRSPKLPAWRYPQVIRGLAQRMSSTHHTAEVALDTYGFLPGPILPWRLSRPVVRSTRQRMN